MNKTHDKKIFSVQLAGSQIQRKMSSILVAKRDFLFPDRRERTYVEKCLYGTINIRESLFIMSLQESIGDFVFPFAMYDRIPLTDHIMSKNQEALAIFMYDIEKNI